MILHQDHGFQLCIVACLHEFWLAHHGGGDGRIDIRVLEQSGAENVHQQAYGRLLEAGPGTFLPEIPAPQGIGLQNGAFVVVAAELVDARLDHFIVPLGHGEGFRAPAFAVEAFDGGVVVRDAPVGADHAVKAELIAQQVGDDIVVVTVTDIPSGRVDAVGDGVIGHHGRGRSGLPVQLESAVDEGTGLRLEVAAGIDGIFAVVEVGVAAALFRAARRPVLDHGVDTLETPAVGAAFRGLESVDIGACHVGIQVGIFTKGADEAVPAGLRGQVDLRTEGCGDAQGPVFFRSDVAELTHQIWVEGGSQSQRGGPERDLSACTGVVFCRHSRLVAGIGAVVGRDAVPQLLDEGLDVVVPAGGHLRAGNRGHQHVAQVVVGQELFLGFGQSGSRDGLVGAVEHQAGDLFDGKLCGEVAGTVDGGFPPVFIYVEGTVAVEVFEGVAALFEDRGGGVTQRGAAALFDAAVAVGFQFLPLGTTGDQKGQGGGQQDEPGKAIFHRVKFLY